MNRFYLLIHGHGSGANDTLSRQELRLTFVNFPRSLALLASERIENAARGKSVMVRLPPAPRFN